MNLRLSKDEKTGEYYIDLNGMAVFVYENLNKALQKADALCKALSETPEE